MEVAIRKTKKQRRHNKQLSRISKSMINYANSAMALSFRYVYTSKTGVVIVPNTKKVRELARLIHNRQMKQRFYIKAFLSNNKIVEHHATFEPPKFNIYKGGEKWQ